MYTLPVLDTSQSVYIPPVGCTRGTCLYRVRLLQYESCSCLLHGPSRGTLAYLLLPLASPVPKPNPTLQHAFRVSPPLSVTPGGLYSYCYTASLEEKASSKPGGMDGGRGYGYRVWRYWRRYPPVLWVSGLRPC